MTLYAIDPGTEQSAVVLLEPHSPRVIGAIHPNGELLDALLGPLTKPGHLVIEQIQSYGMPVGREIFETVFWAGRFAQAWQSKGLKYSWSVLGRRDVKLHVCGSPRANDANIRSALMDRYGGSQSIKKGGPLHGVKGDLWAALALAVTYQDTAKV